MNNDLSQGINIIWNKLIYKAGKQKKFTLQMSPFKINLNKKTYNYSL